MSTTLERTTTATAAAAAAAKDNKNLSEASERKGDQYFFPLKRPFFVGLMVILFVSALPYITLALNSSKFNRAEVFFAECAREMFQTANLVTPLYHGQGFFDKPILVYWMILACFKSFGVSHLAARIPSIVCALGTVALTGVGAGRLFGASAGLLAAMSLGSAFMFMSFATLCMSDMPLVLFETSALALLYTACASARWRNICVWLAALCLGLAFLTKGPVGIVLPAITFALYLTISRQWNLLRPAHILAGALIVACAASPWFFAAYRENGSHALIYFFIRENVQRFAGSTYDTHRPLWYMLVSLFTGFAPWSVFLPFALKDSIKKWKADGSWQGQKAQLLFFLWIGTVTLFFSLSRGKIDYYVLPVYPAAAALTGAYLTQALARKSLSPAVIGWIAATTLMAAGLGSIYFLRQLAGDVSPSQWLLMPIALAGLGAVMSLALRQKLYLRAYSCLFAAICLTGSGFALQVFPVITRLQAVLAFRPTIVSTSQDTRLGVSSSIENWIDEITFQTNREPLKVKNVQGANLFLMSPAEALLLIPEYEFKQLPPETLSRVRIVESRPFVAHSLNPGYMLQRGGKLLDDSRLLLVSNR